MTAPIPDPNNQPPAPNSTSQPTELDVLRAQMNQLTQMVGGLTQVIQQNNIPSAPKVPQYNIHPDDWQNPEKAPAAVAEIVRGEVQAAVAPLLELRNKINRQEAYQAAKAQVKAAYPQIARLWNYIEPQLDNSFMQSNVDVNVQMVLYQAQALIGGLAVTNPSLFASAPSATPPSGANIPPMIHPSGAEPPNNIPKTPALRELTENEERLRKERGITVEQFLKSQEGSAMILEPSFMRGKK